MNRKTRIIAGSLAVLMALVACVVPLPVSAQGSLYSLTITNDSSFTIERVYLSPSYETTFAFSSDQLGSFALPSGYHFTVKNIRAGEYDVLFVDEDGDRCMVRNQNIFSNLNWELTNSWLLNCEGRTKQ